ncbi:hypothetical protein QT231_17545 [Halomonas sp. SpR1]|uniref:hypothetical protein n=1 Tax=Halomonas sp. SpR1 TaxID=3050462 RepID=UPI0027E570A7|nr:hypothetical protein [Halomonas sp. SpR1]MDQ7734516.1 hypothetical protein [Halomonas sp. SpR1]
MELKCSSTKRAVLVATLLTATVSFSVISNADNSRVEQFSKQTAAQNNQGNYSVIAQIGNNNRTNVSQSASYQAGNFSSIYQLGNYNSAEVKQTGGNNISNISQIGRNHKVDITQSGNTSRELNSYVRQIGNRSDVQISQSGSGYRGISVEQQAFSSNARPVTVETY